MSEATVSSSVVGENASAGSISNSCAEQPIEQYVARLLVILAGTRHDGGNTSRQLSPNCRGGRGRLPCVVRLQSASRDQRVATFGQCIGHEKLELADFVTADSEPGLIVAFDEEARPAEVLRQSLQRLQWRGQMSQPHARKRIQFHGTLAPTARIQLRGADFHFAVGVLALGE